MEPCGTPHSTNLQDDSAEFITVFCILLVRKFLNQTCGIPRIPYQDNFRIRRSWFTVSNAFLKSKNIRPVSRPLSMLQSKVSIRCKRAVSVEKPSIFLVIPHTKADGGINIENSKPGDCVWGIKTCRRVSKTYWNVLYGVNTCYNVVKQLIVSIQVKWIRKS